MTTSTNGLIRPPGPPKTPRWSAERVGHLTTLWSQGLTAEQVSRALGGGVTRSSVLAKISRLGIGDLSPYGGRRGVRPGSASTPSGRAAGNVPPPIWLLQRRAPPDWVVNVEPYVEDPQLDADIPPAQRCSFLHLNHGTCRWPVGDPASSSLFFCGAAPLHGQPYCAAHCLRAYEPPK